MRTRRADPRATPERQAGESPAGTSRPGSVVLELGAAVGALTVRADPELDGAELAIRGRGAVRHVRTHALVRPRALPGGTLFAALYPDLPAGRYRLADRRQHRRGIRVTGGAVTVVDLRRNR